MKTRGILFLLAMLVLAGCVTQGVDRAEPAWRGLHLFAPERSGLPLVERAVAEVWAPMGINVLVLEVNYRFAFKSHPELISNGAEALTVEDARRLASVCRANGVRLIPQFNCLGHQSWGTNGGTLPLLAKYPEFDETPWVPASNEGIYCRSWCPLHPDVNKVVFELIDELIAAFEPDAFHAGMDEVFLIGDDKCPRCSGKNPAELFAKAVNDLHKHITEEKGLPMLIWADRLLDMKSMDYNMWESSKNGTAPAIDLIPKDVILCDWHYGKRPEYPSVPYFASKGFRVWPAGWNNPEATLAFIRYSRAHGGNRVLGHLFTTWASAPAFAEHFLGTPSGNKSIVGAADSLRLGLDLK